MNISGILLPVLCAAFIASGFADIPASNVPAPVKAQVQNQFPNAGVIEWDFDHDEDVYEAEFHINGLEYEMKLSADGTVFLIKADVPLQSLPAPVTAAVAKDFPGYALRSAKQITVRGTVKYRVDCRFGKAPPSESWNCIIPRTAGYFPKKLTTDPSPGA